MAVPSDAARSARGLRRELAEDARAATATRQGQLSRSNTRDSATFSHSPLSSEAEQVGTKGLASLEAFKLIFIIN